MIVRSIILQRRYFSSEPSWEQISKRLINKDIPTLKIMSYGVHSCDYKAAISDRNDILNDHFNKLEDAYVRISNIITEECIPTTESLINNIKFISSNKDNIITRADSVTDIMPILEKQTEKLRHLASKFNRKDILDSSNEKVPDINFVVLRNN